MENLCKILVDGTIFYLRGRKTVPAAVAAVIFDCNAVSQLIVGEQLAVSVIDVASGTVQTARLDHAHQKISLAVCAVDDLQLKQPQQKHCSHAYK